MKKLLLLFFALSCLHLHAQPPINMQVTPYSVCTGQGVGVFFLDSKIPEILNGIDVGLVNVTFHFSAQDAEMGINPISSPFTSQGNAMLYVRVEYLANPADYAITTLFLQTTQGPSVPPMEYITCSPENTGFAQIDLNDVTTEILTNTGYLPTEISINYYTSFSDAAAQLNAVSNPFINTSPFQQELWFHMTFLGTTCSTISLVYLNINPCDAPGQPSNLTVCTDTQTACFDLSSNIWNVMGTLDPSNHNVTFHASQADASAGVNAILNLTAYCVPVSMQGEIIYIRLENLTTGAFSLHPFSITSQQFVAGPSLDALTACDDNGDGTVIFDLTTAATQINSTNPLLYYLNSIDAGNNVNAIANPQSAQIAASSQVVAVFVREVIEGGCDILYSLPVNALANCNLANSCFGANAICSTLNVSFPNTVNMPSSGAVDCLGATPNQTWFYIPVNTGGNLSLQISQMSAIGNGIDVDYICYGPFTNPTQGCSMLTSNYVVGCSFSVSAIEYLSISNAPAGSYYLLMVTNFSNQPGQVSINFTGGNAEIDCTGLQFTAFLDSNANGARDNGEVNFPLGNINYVQNNNGVVHNVQTQNGSYTIYDVNPANSYDVSFDVQPAYAANYTVAPASFTDVAVIAGGGTLQNLFAVQPVQTYQDLSVSILALNDPRPGFVYLNRIVVSNNSPLAVNNAVLSFTHGTNVTLNAIIPGAVATALGFDYTIPSLAPFESVSFDLAMLVPLIPIVNLGDLVTNSATIAGDAVAGENDSAVCSREIIGSYDPNDKMETRGRQIDIDEFSESDYLYYTIRFENTGTASAFNVRINDILHSSLMPETIQMISASHPYVLDRVGNNLNWNFNNIMLPHAAADPEGAKGYVHFKIKPQDGFVVGDIIPNTASIFFDFNPPIITNTFETEFVDQLSVAESNAGALRLYPVPASDILRFTADATVQEVRLFDITGKIMLYQKVGAAQGLLDVSSLSTGMYLIQLTHENGTKSTHKVAIQ